MHEPPGGRHARLRPRNPPAPPTKAKSTIDHLTKSRRDKSSLAVAAGRDVTVTVRALAKLPLPGKLPEFG